MVIGEYLKLRKYQLLSRLARSVQAGPEEIARCKENAENFSDDFRRFLREGGPNLEFLYLSRGQSKILELAVNGKKTDMARKETIENAIAPLLDIEYTAEKAGSSDISEYLMRWHLTTDTPFAEIISGAYEGRRAYPLFFFFNPKKIEKKEDFVSTYKRDNDCEVLSDRVNILINGGRLRFFEVGKFNNNYVYGANFSPLMEDIKAIESSED